MTGRHGVPGENDNGEKIHGICKSAYMHIPVYRGNKVDKSMSDMFLV